MVTVNAKQPRPSIPQRILKSLGPGLITGASDDDPSGIATYSQVGAQFGYGMTWTMVLTYPLMCAIQEISARIGRTTGHGIAGNIRQHYSVWLLRGIVALLLIANIVNLGADIAAMGEALTLLIGGPAHLYAVLFAVVSIGLEIYLSYDRYVSILKYLTLSLFAYVATVMVVKVPWGQVAVATFWPHLSLDTAFLTAIVAVFGTTISPYLFFWQSGQEAEEEEEHADQSPLVLAPEQAPAQIERIQIDTYSGMAISNLIAFFIIVTTAATLNANGITDIQSSAQAAEALRPIAGNFAFAVYALGIIGTGLLALPVLAGSAAYAVGEAMEWPIGLARRPMEAKAFYGTISVAALLGVALIFAPIDPIKALFWSAVVNGVIAVPLMVIMMRLAMRKDCMGQFTLPRWLQILGWAATIVMALIVIGMGATMIG